jgi:ribonuclease Z
MLRTLDFKLINDISGDPAVLIRPNQSTDYLLFDAGSLENLSNRELLRIRLVAVSHTHLDHFIGFDRLIRVNIPHFRTIEVVGPTGITENLRSKLKSYTWNLLEKGQLNFIVHEVGPTGKEQIVRLTNDNQFEPLAVTANPHIKDVKESLKTHIQLLTMPRLTLRAITVDHGMQVLAYCLEMPSSTFVSEKALRDLGLEPGPWISEIQRFVATGSLSENIVLANKNWSVEELAKKVLIPRAGETLMYVTDMVFNRNNMERLKSLAGCGVDLLICESNFLGKDRDKAKRKFHLTAHQSALIAAYVDAKNLQIFHVSNIYSKNFSEVELEAMTSLAELRGLNSDELDILISKESS